MDPISATDSIKKHGVIAVLTIVLFFTHSFFSERLDKVEAKLERVEGQLYDCLGDKIAVANPPVTNKNIQVPIKLLAVLPDKTKIRWARSLID
jgi:hypothetical protein